MAKKIKKVETPIDQRETFVSLQKNFADSDLSVEEKLKVLYDLQKADVAIDKIIQLRGELPDEVEALENEVSDLKAKVAQETEVIDKFNKSIAANKQNIVDLDEEKQLVAKRNECAAKIDARTMSAYDRIRNSVHNHLAVVSVYNGDSCGGCFNTITPQRLLEIASNRKLIICEHCGRIIVNADFQ